MEEKNYDMRGVLFKNARYIDGGKFPYLQGDITIEGKKYQIAAWVRVSQKGTKFFSVTATPSQPQEQQPQPQQEDDGLPF